MLGHWGTKHVIHRMEMLRFIYWWKNLVCSIVWGQSLSEFIEFKTHCSALHGNTWCFLCNNRLFGKVVQLTNKCNTTTKGHYMNERWIFLTSLNSCQTLNTLGITHNPANQRYIFFSIGGQPVDWIPSDHLMFFAINVANTIVLYIVNGQRNVHLTKWHHCSLYLLFSCDS